MRPVLVSRQRSGARAVGRRWPTSTRTGTRRARARRPAAARRNRAAALGRAAGGRDSGCRNPASPVRAYRHDGVERGARDGVAADRALAAHPVRLTDKQARISDDRRPGIYQFFNISVASFGSAARSLVFARRTSGSTLSHRACSVTVLVRQQPTSSATVDRPKLTVVLPIYNEEESPPPLLEALVGELDGLYDTYEIIAVNDGSRDGSQQALEAAAEHYPHLKITQFRCNAGQTAALMAGIDHASGDVIVTSDADLQNDPRDIPLMLAKLGEGYDVVSGWRQDRQDAAIRRNLVSRIANRLISRISGVRLHDYGCTLKAYRKEVLQGMRLYGEMHRFVPIYASWMGAKVIEVPVRHHARQFGSSNYGLDRIFKVILDLVVVKFFSGYLVKPIYIFGGVAAVFMLISGVAFMSMLYLKFVEGLSMIQTPLPVLSAMLFVLAVVVLLMGVLAEIMVRTYFESQGRLPYHIRSTINFDKAV